LIRRRADAMARQVDDGKIEDVKTRGRKDRREGALADCKSAIRQATRRLHAARALPWSVSWCVGLRRSQTAATAEGGNSGSTSLRQGYGSARRREISRLFPPFPPLTAFGESFFMKEILPQRPQRTGLLRGFHRLTRICLANCRDRRRQNHGWQNHAAAKGGGAGGGAGRRDADRNPRDPPSRRSYGGTGAGATRGSDGAEKAFLPNEAIL
jgi:hypothetical protein